MTGWRRLSYSKLSGWLMTIKIRKKVSSGEEMEKTKLKDYRWMNKISNFRPNWENILGGRPKSRGKEYPSICQTTLQIISTKRREFWSNINAGVST